MKQNETTLKHAKLNKLHQLRKRLAWLDHLEKEKNIYVYIKEKNV